MFAHCSSSTKPPLAYASAAGSSRAASAPLPAGVVPCPPGSAEASSLVISSLAPTHNIFATFLWFCNISAGRERGYKRGLSVPSRRPLAGKGFTSLPRNLRHFTPTGKWTLQPSAWLGCYVLRAENKFPRAHVLLPALCLINLYQRDGNETDQSLGCLWCAETRQFWHGAALGCFVVWLVHNNSFRGSAFTLGSVFTLACFLCLSLR